MMMIVSMATLPKEIICWKRGVLQQDRFLRFNSLLSRTLLASFNFFSLAGVGRDRRDHHSHCV